MTRVFDKAMHLTVIFPFLALLVWILTIDHKMGEGKTVFLKIVGYDPVDLLSGHYLRFRYDLGPSLCPQQDAVTAKIASGSVCTCLEPSLIDKTMKAGPRLNCEGEADSCSMLVKGYCERTTFLTGSERFYFPEQYAAVLAVLPPDSIAEVALQRDGSLAIKDIHVQKETILEYAKRNLKLRAP